MPGRLHRHGRGREAAESAVCLGRSEHGGWVWGAAWQEREVTPVIASLAIRGQKGGLKNAKQGSHVAESAI